MNSLKLTKEPKFWLLGTAAGLIAIHLHSVWKYGNTDLLGTTILFWLAISSLLKEKWETLSLESDPFSSLFGVLAIAWVLLKAAFLPADDLFLRLSPFVAALGLGLLASGVSGLKQYWKELLLLSFLAVPPGLLSRLVALPLLTAKFVTLVLWYLGFQVSRNGIHVMLPTGSVEVDYGCSGTAAILQLLGLAFLFLAMFPSSWKQKILVPIVAVLIAFSVNGVRISILAYLVAFSNLEVFEYWHQGQGSMIFSFISAIIFGLFCHFLLLRSELKNKDSVGV